MMNSKILADSKASHPTTCNGLGAAILAMLLFFSLSYSDTGDIGPEELLFKLKNEEKPLVIDVRTTQEYLQGHVPSAINIPHFLFETHIDSLKGYKKKDIVLYCRSGGRVRVAEFILKKNGFSQIFRLKGNIKAWMNGGWPLDTAPVPLEKPPEPASAPKEKAPAIQDSVDFPAH